MADCSLLQLSHHGRHRSVMCRRIFFSSTIQLRETSRLACPMRKSTAHVCAKLATWRRYSGSLKPNCAMASKQKLASAVSVFLEDNVSESVLRARSIVAHRCLFWMKQPAHSTLQQKESYSRP